MTDNIKELANLQAVVLAVTETNVFLQTETGKSVQTLTKADLGGGGGGGGDASAAKQDLLLTELQLKADLTETQPVGVTARVCVSHQTITVPITTGVTLASLCSGGIIPVGAVTCAIQALDGVVRCSLKNGVTATPTTLTRINTDETLLVDSVLASVTLVAQSTTPILCSVMFSDRV